MSPQPIQFVDGVLLHRGPDALHPLLHLGPVFGLDLVRRVSACNQERDHKYQYSLVKRDARRSLRKGRASIRFLARAGTDRARGESRCGAELAAISKEGAACRVVGPTLHHPALAVHLGALDGAALLCDDLKAVRTLRIRDLPDEEVLERDGALWLVVFGLLKVVEAVIDQREPALLPVLGFAALLHQPAVALRVEERGGLAVLVLGQLKWVGLDAREDLLEELVR